MRKATVLLWVCCWGLTGCSDDFDEGYEPVPEEAEIMLYASKELHIDKSLVFFFRNFEGGDSLVYQTQVEGPTEKNPLLNFKLPAGYYRMVLIGNGEADHIVLSPGRSWEGSYINYSDGTEPPELYYGSGIINVGEKKRGGAAIMPITSLVTLTVENVPVGVDQIDVDLKNTDSRVYFGLERDYIPTEPCITKSLYEVKAGTSPVLRINCLPTAPRNADSYLEVRCYDRNDQLVFRGRSASFVMGGMENISLSCSFEGTSGKSLSLSGQKDRPEKLSGDFSLRAVKIK